MANYEEKEVVAQLKKKHDLRIEGRMIQELTRKFSKGDVGNKSNGKIDYLTRYCGYTHVFVDSFKGPWTPKF